MIELPGLVVAHTHLYSALARGMPPPHGRPQGFLEVLERVWWRLDRALDLPLIRMSARVGIAQAVRAGATCIVDHHESPLAIEGSLDAIADEMQKAGVRGAVAYGITARNRGRDEWQAGLAENERFLRENRRPLVRGLVGLHACFTLQDEALEAAADLARRSGAALHAHVAEGAVDKDAFARLEHARALLPGSVWAHAVHLGVREVQALCASGGWLVQNARSNMNNGVGWARLAPAGDRVALGTDGWDGDVLAEARALALRAAEARDEADPLQRLEAGRALAASLFGGTAGDQVLLDYEPPTPFGGENLRAHLLSGEPRVCEVRVAGARIEPPAFDPAEAREAAQRLWKRMAEVR